MDLIAANARPEVRAPLLSASRSARTPGKINLRAVAEVLADRGMDPTEEILKALRGLDADGEPILKADGTPRGSLLDDDTKARVLLELLQYVQPKLKSVEIRAKVATMGFDVSDEQAKRIAEEFLTQGMLE